VTPLFQFHNCRLSLPYNWTTISNGAAFGTDYYSRTAAAKAHILVNTVRETKYLYQNADGTGQQLNGGHAYAVTFAGGKLPPVKGFWTLTSYNQYHFFSANEIDVTRAVPKTRLSLLRARALSPSMYKPIRW
jgi:hypothetical protein